MLRNRETFLRCVDTPLMGDPARVSLVYHSLAAIALTSHHREPFLRVRSGLDMAERTSIPCPASPEPCL